MTAIVLDGLPAIGLDELVDRAPLLTRVDRKYILPASELPTILSGLGRHPHRMRVLDIDGRRDFAYQSRYFDTPGLDSYLGAAHRRRRRFKVRVRSYVDTDLHLLEVKTRGPRGTTVKHRAAHRGHPERLDADARRFLDTVLSTCRISADVTQLSPALMTHYQRTTLFLPGSASRVTIDTALAWTLPSGEAIRWGDRAIVETKSGRAASEVDRLLWSLRHRPCTVSKYGTGLAALQPHLPAHRWRPALRRYFQQKEA